MANDVLQFLMLPFTKVLPFLVVLTVVVFVHEMGHFLVARWCGVAVRTFSIGFGKEIWGFTDKLGTRWRLAWIPLGGYVKFMDDDNAASVPSKEAIASMTPEQRAGSFHAKPVWKRAAVVAAGPAANFILAVVIFALWFFVVRTLSEVRGTLKRERATRIDSTPRGALETIAVGTEQKK